MNDNKTKHQ